jgi:hypothetical protein
MGARRLRSSPAPQLSKVILSLFVKTEASPAIEFQHRAHAEAARYSVLRRLAPTLKHDMVVNLQAISMMAEVLNARMERGSGVPAEFQAHITKLNRLAREAVLSSLKVAGWIEPGEGEAIRLDEGVSECVAVLANHFNFRGFLVATELPDTEFRVWRTTLRNLLVASLLFLTDGAAGPCELRIEAEVLNGWAELSVQIRQSHGEAEGQPFEPGYRRLDWSDVQSLAAAESVEVTRAADRIVLRIPRAVATAPVRIAPV